MRKQDTFFISHSSVDAEFAEILARDLEARGVDVWLDVSNIEPNSDWNESIQSALTNSHYILVIWSKNSVISPEVLAEVFQARAAGKKIIQVFIDDCKRPAVFDRLQNIDFRGNYEEALEKLLGFLPIIRREQRLEELRQLLPDNPYPSVPEWTN